MPVQIDYRIANTGYSKRYTYSEIFTGSAVISTAATTQFGAVTFQLSDLPAATSLSTLYDKYRFKSVEVLFRATGMQMNTSTGGSNDAPDFTTVIDFDNASVPTTITQLQRYSTAKVTTATSNHYRHFLPRTVRPVYISGVSTGYAEGDATEWLDLSYPNIPHYALLYALGFGGSNSTFALIPTIKYVVEFAASR